MIFFRFGMEAREDIGCQAAIGNDTFDSGYRSRYHSRVYLRFISFKMRELPLCTGRWICLHTFGTRAITSSVSSLISFGWEVVKRTRTPGSFSYGTKQHREGNDFTGRLLKPVEFTFCPSRGNFFVALHHKIRHLIQNALYITAAFPSAV